MSPKSLYLPACSIWTLTPSLSQGVAEVHHLDAEALEIEHVLGRHVDAVGGGGQVVFARAGRVAGRRIPACRTCGIASRSARNSSSLAQPTSRPCGSSSTALIRESAAALRSVRPHVGDGGRALPLRSSGMGNSTGARSGISPSSFNTSVEPSATRPWVLAAVRTMAKTRMTSHQDGQNDARQDADEEFTS